ncbi:hypothetical protein K4F52_002386 [Lecanicillium sp. MT-2017a]|nr:hypothetical protein K4F52_002386 [Lecanicillium sp. MT-2017a]
MTTAQLSDAEIEDANLDAVDQANALIGEAEGLAESDEWPRVMSLCRQAIDICTQRLGPLHLCTLWHIKKKGAYLRQQGQYAEAERVDRGLLAKWESKPTRDDMYELSVLDVMHNLVDDLRPQGLHDEVIVVQTDILQAVIRDRGEEAQYTSVCKGKLANSLYRRGDYDEAFRLHKEAFTTLKRLGCGETPDYAILLDMAGLDCRAMGDIAQAQALQEEAVALAEKICGPRDDTTIRCIANLSLTYRKSSIDLTGWRQKLENLARELVPPGQQLRRITADLFMTLGNIYFDEERYRDAKEAYVKCLAWAEENLGREHSFTVMSLESFASASTKAGDLVWAPVVGSDVTGIPSSHAPNNF